jgi:hypothetical protein
MRKLTILIAMLAVAVALPTVALGRDNPGAIKTGKCSNGASWKLKAKNENGLIEVEFEVDQNVSGRRWRVVLRRNGTAVFRGARTTRPPSGSFEINTRLGNPAGPDRIVATARATAGGSCRGALTF